MAVFIETVIIAAVVALGIIVGGAAIIRGFVVSRRPSHHTATHRRFTGTADSRYAAAWGVREMPKEL